MKDAIPVSAPLENSNLSREKNVKIDFEKISYRQAVGSLMYIAVATQQDFAFAASHCSQFLNKVKKEHWSMIKKF